MAWVEGMRPFLITKSYGFLPKAPYSYSLYRRQRITTPARMKTLPKTIPPTVSGPPETIPATRKYIPTSATRTPSSHRDRPVVGDPTAHPRYATRSRQACPHALHAYRVSIAAG